MLRKTCLERSRLADSQDYCLLQPSKLPTLGSLAWTTREHAQNKPFQHQPHPQPRQLRQSGPTIPSPRSKLFETAGESMGTSQQSAGHNPYSFRYVAGACIVHIQMILLLYTRAGTPVHTWCVLLYACAIAHTHTHTHTHTPGWCNNTHTCTTHLLMSCLQAGAMGLQGMLLNRNMRAVLIRHYLHFQTVYTIYGTVTVWYGQQPYNTVKMKIRYGSGTVRETGRPYKLAWPPVLRCLPQVAYSLNFLYSWCIV